MTSEIEAALARITHGLDRMNEIYKRSMVLPDTAAFVTSADEVLSAARLIHVRMYQVGLRAKIRTGNRKRRISCA